MKKMKAAIVYDRVNKWGGAERVLLYLHKMFPDAPLYTSVYDEAKAPWAKVFPEIRTSFLQNFPFAKSNHEFLAPLMPTAFETFGFDEFDLVISVTSEAAKGIITKPHTKHICYCLTPTRYLWSGYKEYFANPLTRFLLNPIINYLRTWDKIAAQRPDEIIAISTEVKERIKKYYGRDSETIFPPANSVSASKRTQKGKYYLIVSRLVPYKKVDLVIKAFNRLDYPLVIAGEGRENDKLRFMSKNNIKFTGQVSEEKLANLYLGAKALIMPQEEDFGLVSIESQASGVPVIAFKKGGAMDTVIDGKTGVFFNRQDMGSLIAAVKRFEKTGFVVDNLYTNAKRFSEQNFKKEFFKFI